MPQPEELPKKQPAEIHVEGIPRYAGDITASLDQGLLMQDTHVTRGKQTGSNLHIHAGSQADLVFLQRQNRRLVNIPELLEAATEARTPNGVRVEARVVSFENMTVAEQMKVVYAHVVSPSLVRSRPWPHTCARAYTHTPTPTPKPTPVHAHTPALTSTPHTGRALLPPVRGRHGGWATVEYVYEAWVHVTVDRLAELEGRLLRAVCSNSGCQICADHHSREYNTGLDKSNPAL